MEYTTGYEFWNSLAMQFGGEAVDVANRYLDLPMKSGDTEELQFRKELYSAVSQTANLKEKAEITKEYKLTATTQKSYYGKAVVIERSGKTQLKSYSTIVCEVDPDGNFYKLWNGYSRTTMNHINDFRRLFSLAPLYKKEWDKLPCESTRKYKLTFNNIFRSWNCTTIFDNALDAHNYGCELCDRNNHRIQYSVSEI